MIKKIFSNLFSSSMRLSNLDKLVLSRVRGRLDSRVGLLWDKQVAAINKIQRLPRGVEVDFYRMGHGRPAFDSAIAFPNRSSEALVAEVDVLSQTCEQINAKVWSVEGFLFSIEYLGPVSFFQEGLSVISQDDFIVNCRLLTDLSKESS